MRVVKSSHNKGCMGDNPLAKYHGLSTCTGGQTIVLPLLTVGGLPDVP